MKRIFVFLLVSVLATSIFAQQQGKVRGGLDLGVCVPRGGGGICMDIPIGYNIRDNMNVGIKGGAAFMAKVDPFGDTGSLSANVNLLGTFTYFFSSGESSFAPFVGGGTGIYAVGGLSVGTNDVSVELGPRIGVLLTAGFELSKFRMAAEYNIVTRSAVKVNSTGVEVENSYIKNSYLAITVGFYIGGGKWKKQK